MYLFLRHVVYSKFDSNLLKYKKNISKFKKVTKHFYFLSSVVYVSKVYEIRKLLNYSDNTVISGYLKYLINATFI
jgi:hypothetical protein